MSAPITTPYGVAVPPAPRHSVTVHMPGWDNVQRYAADAYAAVAAFKDAYPRMKPHPDIRRLARAVLEHIGAAGQACYLFASLQSARECVTYSTSSRRDNGSDRRPVAPEHIRVRAFAAKDRFFAVIFPLDQRPIVAGFWVVPGSGLSSRFAEANLDQLDRLTEVAVVDDAAPRPSFDGPVHQLLRERIISHLERAPSGPQRQPRPSAADVYFYPSGMAAIYKPHTYLLSRYQGTAVLFGMAFLNTVQAFEEVVPSHRFFGLGTEQDLDHLEAFLRDERSQGRKVQAIWTEFPANPILFTPDIDRLRTLADEYDTFLIIDDTLGSWANIDVMDKADMLVTSMTKSFNGRADAIAGSAILNPSSPKYRELKSLFAEHYVSELYVRDAEAIEENSRDYLSRTAKLNHNAAALAQYLDSCAKDPESAVRRVFYPSLNPSGKHYKRFMRSPTPERTPGYGCLLSVELEDLAAAKAFYDNLNVHKGPHLGAPFTLAIPYTICAFSNRLDWAAQCGLKPTQIRISAGLEDTETLLKDFMLAVEAANKTRESL